MCRLIWSTLILHDSMKLSNWFSTVANPLSATNTPLHPAEVPPTNSTIPTGGGFRIVLPNKVGAWDFRSFTFAPDQIVVNQGDKVTLHFIGVLGVHHIITVDGVGTFALHRGQIHTVSFIANNPGTINFWCSLHLPNMVGQILVLPKSVWATMPRRTTRTDIRYEHIHIDMTIIFLYLFTRIVSVGEDLNMNFQYLARVNR